MANLRVVIGIILLLLVFVSGGLIIVVLSQRSGVSDAENLGKSLLDYFKKVDKKCEARYKDFPGLQTCVENLKLEIGIVGQLKEQSFADFNPKKSESGFLVLENKGRTRLNSSEFTLYKNHEPTDFGCVIEGSIDPGYLCRLEFNTVCVKGDVLEVMYQGRRAFLKTC